MSIFPFVEPIDETEESDDLPLAKEWAWDFEKGDFKYINNKPYLVEGIEAVKIWALKSLSTERFKHTFYSWDYGSEVISLIGSGFTSAAVESEAKRLVEEGLYPNPYINGIDNVEIVFDQDSLEVSFTIDTIYGETEVNTIGN